MTKDKTVGKTSVNVESSKYYTNRELSWIQFNERVLCEAEDESNPLLERVKFLSISASNLDEFFMVRVASLKDMINAEYKKPDIAGMTATKQLHEVLKKLHDFTENQYAVYNDCLMPLLEENGFNICDISELGGKELAYAERYFDEVVFPVLTPMAVDSSRPFPLIRNKTLNIGALLKKKEGKDDVDFATVQVPDVLPRLFHIPGNEENKFGKYIFLENLIMHNVDKLYLNYDVIASAPYRVERNADLSIDEDEAEDLLKEIEKQIKKRQWGQAIRLEVSTEMD